MNKKLFTVLAIVLVMMIAFAGCSKSEPKETGSSEGTVTPQEIIIATGGTGGSYYPYGGAMAQIFSAKIEGVSASASSTGASAENARLLNSKEADLAIIQNDVLDYAYNGTEFMAEGGKLENLATIATLYPEVVQLVVSADSGINSIEDIKGKHISVGAAGSGTEANARQILEAYGITYDDFQVDYLSFAEISTGVQNKTLDGGFITAGVPNSSILELAAMTDVKLITIDADKIQALIDKYGFYASYTIPAGTYENIEGECTTVTVLATLACSKDLDETLVYNITKALYENKDELALAYEKASLLDTATATQGASVPLHPGAQKYFDEVAAK